MDAHLQAAQLIGELALQVLMADIRDDRDANAPLAIVIRNRVIMQYQRFFKPMVVMLFEDMKRVGAVICVMTKIHLRGMDLEDILAASFVCIAILLLLLAPMVGIFGIRNSAMTVLMLAIVATCLATYLPGCFA